MSGIISSDVNNTGRIGVSSGIIDITLKDPDGAVVSTGSQTFNIGVGQITTVSIPVTIPSLKFGNYTSPIPSPTKQDRQRHKRNHFQFSPGRVFLRQNHLQGQRKRRI